MTRATETGASFIHITVHLLQPVSRGVISLLWKLRHLTALESKNDSLFKQYIPAFDLFSLALFFICEFILGGQAFIKHKTNCPLH